MRKLLLVPAVCAIATVVAAAGQQAPLEPKLKVGDQAPAFSLPGTDGKTHNLSDYKGKAVILAWFPKAATQG